MIRTMSGHPSYFPSSPKENQSGDLLDDQPIVIDRLEGFDFFEIKELEKKESFGPGPGPRKIQLTFYVADFRNDGKFRQREKHILKVPFSRLPKTTKTPDTKTSEEETSAPGAGEVSDTEGSETESFISETLDTTPPAKETGPELIFEDDEDNHEIEMMKNKPREDNNLYHFLREFHETYRKKIADFLLKTYRVKNLIFPKKNEFFDNSSGDYWIGEKRVFKAPYISLETTPAVLKKIQDIPFKSGEKFRGGYLFLSSTIEPISLAENSETKIVVRLVVSDISLEEGGG